MARKRRSLRGAIYLLLFMPSLVSSDQCINTSYPDKTLRTTYLWGVCMDTAGKRYSCHNKCGI